MTRQLFQIVSKKQKYISTAIMHHIHRYSPSGIFCVSHHAHIYNAALIQISPRSSSYICLTSDSLTIINDFQLIVISTPPQSQPLAQ